MQNILIIHKPTTKGPWSNTFYQGNQVDFRYFQLYKLTHPKASKSMVIIEPEKKLMGQLFKEIGLLESKSVWRTLADWKKQAVRYDLLPIVIPFDLDAINDEHYHSTPQFDFDLGYKH